MTAQKLLPLPINKSVVFCSPVEGEDTLVRTGVASGPSNFLHAILYAHSTKYINSSEIDRNKLVVKISNKILKKDNLISPFKTFVLELVQEFYNKVINNECKDENIKFINSVILSVTDQETYEIICELISVSDFEKEVFSKVFESSKSKIESCKNKLVEKTQKLAEKAFSALGDIDIKRKNFCIDKTVKLIEKVAEFAEQKVYEKSSVSVSLDTKVLKILTKKLNRNFYFLEAKDRLPYKVLDEHYYENRKSIILLRVNEKHYEPVGKLLPTNRVQRELPDKNHITDKIFTILFQPQNLPRKYPQLTEFIKKREYLKSKSKSFDSSDEDEEESDEEESDEEESDEESDEEDDKEARKKHKKHKHKHKHNKK